MILLGVLILPGVPPSRHAAIGSPAQRELTVTLVRSRLGPEWAGLGYTTHSCPTWWPLIRAWARRSEVLTGDLTEDLKTSLRTSLRTSQDHTKGLTEDLFH